MDKNVLIKKLFQRYLANQSSPEEVDALLEMFVNTENDSQLRELIGREMRIVGEHENDLDSIPDEIFQQINVKKEDSGVLIVPMIKRVKFWIAAASVLFFLGITFFYYSSHSQKKVLNSTAKSKKIEQIVPGTEKALLTLSDGRSIVLDGAANGQIAEQGNARVVKLTNGQLAYKIKGETSSEILFNTVSTPRGGQYKLVLPDGSMVWLNASSSVTFPTEFNRKERRVEISGEVYFEVLHNPAVPFKVNIHHNDGVDGGEVTVLGTHFNVNAYKDEFLVKTTLLEGSVKVVKGAASRLLKPGEQSQLNANGQLATATVDIDEVVGWKNGSFVFNRESVAAIMRQISRWYDVDVVYPAKASNKTFSAVISRSGSIAQVLNIMKAGGIKFNIEGKKITVL